MKKKTLSKFMAAALCLTMLAGSLNGCSQKTEKTDGTEANKPDDSDTSSDEPTVTDEEPPADEPSYIEAPYTAGSEAPVEYAEPVFYENEGGPSISVTYVGVIQQDGKYFKDSNNNKELDPFEDWRLSTEERMADLLGKMTQEQRIGLLRNALMSSPTAEKAEDAYNEDGTVKMDALVTVKEEEPEEKEEGDGGFNQAAAQQAAAAAYAASNVTETYTRSGVIRKDTDTETGALFNNALNQLSEWVAASKNEVMVPFMLISNPMLAGYPQALGFGAAAAGDSYDLIKSFAELDAEIWDAKGIHQMYGPQIDLITDPRWSRNNTTYSENPDDMAGIASALVEGYQHGTDGTQTGDVGLIIKHFPGDGAAENGFESHFGMGQWRIYATEGSLEKYHLPGFQAAIDAGVAGIMPGYSRPAADERSVAQSYKGTEITAEEIANAYNTNILQKLLIETMGFKGFINTDSGVITQGMQFGAEDLSEAERIAAVINAGCDTIGDGFSPVIDYTTTAEAVTSGGVTEEAFDRATTNRMTSWLDLGMFDNPYRDPAESKKAGEDNADAIAAMKEDVNRKSVVLMKNHDNVLPLTDASKKVYLASYTEKGPNEETVAAWTEAIEGMGFTIVKKAAEADIAILDVAPRTPANGDEFLHEINLVENKEVAHVDPKTQEPDGTTVEVTTLQDVKKIAKDAAAVHKNGGIVITSINITSPWILTSLEPHTDALIGSFGTSAQARMDVLTGNYKPTGKLPVTMVSCEEVIAVDENNICASPNDVPGYDKDQYIDKAVLDKSPSGSYAYKDADGNSYVYGFSLTMEGDALAAGESKDDAEEGKKDTKDEGKDSKPAEGAASADAIVINYEATPDAFEGEWTLTGAYTAADGMLAVKENACFLEIEQSIDTNKLVDEAAYIHADAVNLSGTMTFDSSISENSYRCSSNWEKWTTVNVIGEGNCEFSGANQFKIRDDDEGVFFKEIAGADADELLNVIAVNSDGQLLVGYSEDHIENDESAEWEYVYIFSK